MPQESTYSDDENTEKNMKAGSKKEQVMERKLAMKSFKFKHALRLISEMR